MKSSVRVGLALAASVWAGAAGAQTQGADEQALQRLREQVEKHERLQAIEANRAQVVAEIAGRFASAINDGGSEYQRALARASAETLRRAQDARSTAELDGLIFNRHPGGIVPNQLGSDASDLVYFPVTPCRLVDTRVAGGFMAAGVPRDFDANGADLSGQGGSATGCGGANDPDAAAIAVTIVAVNPQGAGNLRAWPTTGVVPNASVVNYALPGTGLNLAASTILPLLQSGANVNEFTVRADTSDVHLVIDVVGSFFSPRRAALTCQTVSITGQTLPANDVATINSPACPAGTTLTGGGIDTNFSTAEIWVYQSEPNAAGNGWTCSARSQHGLDWAFFECHARCCSTPGR